MIWGWIALLVVGVLLSAFFSGSETGFYRVNRVRLVLDGLGGDSISRGLLWLTNNPALFVATTLVGNNMANYVTSLAMVGLAHAIYAGNSVAAELIAPIAFAPLVFVYGESLPKNLYYHAPNRLLRLSGPFFLLCTVLFVPISAVLWTLGRVLQWLVGESPARVQLRLARRELTEVLQKGQEAGILHPLQRSLAQNLFTLADRSARDLCVPIAKVTSVEAGSDKGKVLQVAQREQLAVIPVRDAASRHVIGYLRTVDVLIGADDDVGATRELMEIRDSESHSAALMRMQAAKEPVARVIDSEQKTIGLLYFEQLTKPLFRRVSGAFA